MNTEIQLKEVVKRSLNYVSKLQHETDFRLFERSSFSPYARCFIIFTRALCKDRKWLSKNKIALIHSLNNDLSIFYKSRLSEIPDEKFDKPILQLLCFTLSALYLLNGSLSETNKSIVRKYLKSDLEADLISRGVFKGAPGSGNYAMFRAVLLLYANTHLDLDFNHEIAHWISMHISTANRNGFWGPNDLEPYLQFQNGYHQYEILEYLNVAEAPWKAAADHTVALADQLGHFAPYPGGGGCFDYDATFLLTSHLVVGNSYKEVVEKTLITVLSEQNDDGGFCESKLLRTHNGLPRPLALLNHIRKQPIHCRHTSALIGLNLCRPKHRVVRTHWCEEDRYWHESNAWDTYFRLLLIARAIKFLGFPGGELFEVNEYPGIG